MSDGHGFLTLRVRDLKRQIKVCAIGNHVAIVA